MKDFKFYVIIVAGGSGKRMSNNIPKQFLTILDKPILMHTIEKFHYSTYKPQIIVVIPEIEVETWKNLQLHYHFNIPHQVVFGGTERFYSVQNSLQYITNPDAVVAIHDAVRPLVTQKTINKCFDTALVNGNAIAAVTAKDSIRIKEENKNKAIARDHIYLVQTPQVFKLKQLTIAYQQEFNSNFTDDASVVEKAGYDIFLEEGDQFNFKITYQEDLVIAEALLKQQL